MARIKKTREREYNYPQILDNNNNLNKIIKFIVMMKRKTNSSGFKTKVVLEVL